MPNGYSKADLESMREALTPGVQKAKLLASMQIDAAIDLANEREMDLSDKLVVALAQVIATNWNGLD